MQSNKKINNINLKFKCHPSLYILLSDLLLYLQIPGFHDLHLVHTSLSPSTPSLSPTPTISSSLLRVRVPVEFEAEEEAKEDDTVGKLDMEDGSCCKSDEDKEVLVFGTEEKEEKEEEREEEKEDEREGEEVEEDNPKRVISNRPTSDGTNLIPVSRKDNKCTPPFASPTNNKRPSILNAVLFNAAVDVTVAVADDEVNPEEDKDKDESKTKSNQVRGPRF